MSLVPEAVRVGAWAAGSDAPEKKEVKIGFIPLTDCSSVVMASVMEFDKKYGIKITPSKEASWAAVRDKLVNGELDASHVLYGLIYGVQMGVGGPKKDMAVLMGLNHNGQAFTLSRKLYRSLHSPVLLISIRTRVALAIGVVFLMTVKPSLGAALVTIGAAVVLGMASALPTLGRMAAREESGA